MKRFISGAFACAVMLCGLGSGPAPAHAQVLQTAQNDVALLAEWLEEVTPVIQKAYEINEPADRAAIVVEEFSVGAISIEDAKAQLALYSEETRLITERVQAELRGLPPMPKLTTIELSSALSNDSLVDLAQKISDVGLSSIQMLIDAVDGNIDAVDAGFRRSFDQTVTLVEVSNALVEADKAAVSSTTHPQLTLLDCLMNSNEMLIDVLEVQGAFYSYSMDKTLEEALSGLAIALRRHEKLVKRGEANHATTEKSFQIARASAGLADQQIIDTVIKAFETYDDNWAFERELIAGGTALLSVLRSDDASETDIEDAIDEFFEIIVFVEEERSRIILDRVRMMQ